ncbi:gamma-glutamylcyclotransferase family protein [Hyphomonas oceanitis]|uniref:gamma-glutamylcyclotransferase family protein n=1 Tax=Hyphomonas oceanitis TaxID=81033 RepID=UPI00300259F4
MSGGAVKKGDLFVFYGLLKQGAAGQPADLPLEVSGKFLGACRFRGRLLDLGGFPGVVEGEQLCHGVRYELNDVSIIGAMDEFEDVTDDPATSLYTRQQIPLLDDHGAPTGEQAWIYWYNQPTEGFTDIPDGNWPLDRGRTRK